LQQLPLMATAVYKVANCVVDVIDSDRFCDNVVKSFGFAVGHISHFPHESDIAVITALRYRTTTFRLIKPM